VTHDVALEAAGVVTGRVVDKEGSPVSGAQVRARGGADDAFAFIPLDDATTGMTGKDGSYVLDSVRPGDEIHIMVRHPAYIDGLSKPIVVTSGSTTRAEKIVMSAGLSLDITVRDPRGAPFGDARVELSYERETDVEWDMLDMWTGDAVLRSDARGKVLQDRVPPSKVTISASHPDYAMGRTEIEAKEGAASPLRAEVRLLEAMVLAGRVLDQEGRPISGAFVNAQVAAAAPFDAVVHTDPTAPSAPVNSVSRTDFTDEEGRFRIDRLPRGVARLDVSAGGYGRTSVTVPGPSEAVEVRLVPLDPRVEERRREIQARLMEIYQGLGSAASDAERQALVQEMTALQQELAALPGDDSPFGAPPEPEPIEIEMDEVEEEELEEVIEEMPPAPPDPD
jgi:protocatechuate 3,4-dioxygenase beta subunit